MADVVRIWDRLERLPRRPMMKLYDAQILLFTGVRYERHDGIVRPPENNGSQQANQI